MESKPRSQGDGYSNVGDECGDATAVVRTGTAMPCPYASRGAVEEEAVEGHGFGLEGVEFD
jgi:hypothetical protein